MGLFIYNILLIILAPAVLLYFLYQTLVSRRFKYSWKQRLTIQLEPIPDSPLIHIHAASVGEATSLIPVVKALRKTLPQYKLLITSLSQTGYNTVKDRLNPAISTYLPVDYPWLINRFMAHYKPEMLLLMETEFWPNLIDQARKHNLPIIVANGRVSPGTLKRYHIFSSLYRPLVQNITLFIAQSDDDAKRAEEIGISPSKITVTQDIKYDQIVDNPSSMKLKQMKDTLRPPGNRIIVAGSTHPGEQEPLIDEFKKLTEKNPDTWLILAPRHLETVASVKAKLKRTGIRYLERSRQLAENKEWTSDEKVLILDTMGELAYIYYFATVAFVGGSLVPIGGHSPLEPAIFGKPVLTGPLAFNFTAANNLLIKAGAMEIINDIPHLMEVCQHLLNFPQLAEKRGTCGMDAVKSVSGASNIIAQHINDTLTQTIESASG